MDHLDQYALIMRRLDEHQQFDSQEEGIAAANNEQGEISHFVVSGRQGTFEFHRCYWQRNELVSQCDWSTSHSELHTLRQLAARQLGELELDDYVDEVELSL